MVSQNLEASTLEESFQERLDREKGALAEELSDRLRKFQSDTGVADLYVAQAFVQGALTKALDIALGKEKGELPK